MKIKGEYFKRCMEATIFRASEGVLSIHSYAKDGSGIIRKLVNDADTDKTEEMTFFLTKSDADVVSSFKDLDVSFNEKTNTITFESAGTKCRFQNVQSIKEPEPPIKDAKPVFFTLAELKAAAAVADLDEKHPDNKGAGILVGTDSLITYDKQLSLYYRHNGGEGSGAADPVRIPVTAIKLADSGKTYNLRLSDKAVVLMADSEIIYSSVYPGYTLSFLDYDPKPAGNILIGKDHVKDFVNHIKMCSMFDQNVRITPDGDSLHIENYLNLENPRVYEANVPASSNIESYSMLLNARGMLKLLAALDVINGEDLTLLVDDKMVRVDSSNDFVVMAATLNAQNVQLKLKGEADGNG